MENKPGAFIALEGADGSGKTVQFHLLAARLKAIGYEVEVFDFPRYDEPSSHFVRNYLNGHYGPATTISPYAASLFFALDRFEAAPAIRLALQSGKVVLTNRYVGSNMAHQGAKFENPAEQRGFFVWVDSLEFHLLGIPRPDLNIFLRLPAEYSFRRIGQKSKRSYTAKSHDEHESDIEHLRKSIKTYELLGELFPKDFVTVDSLSGKRVLNVAAINDRIWEVIQSLLPDKKTQQARSVTINLAADRQAPPKGSRAEFAGRKYKIINEGGSASQLELNVPQISLLALSVLETVPGIVIESSNLSPRTIDTTAVYSLNLPRPLKERYEKTMRRVGLSRQKVSRQLKQYSKGESIPREDVRAVGRALTPMATLTSARLKGSSVAFHQLSQTISGSSLSELSELDQLITNLLKKRPTEGLEAKTQAASSRQPELLQETIARLAQSRLSPTLSDSLEPTQLLNYWPRNEFELLIDGLYPHTNLSRAEIAAEIANWPYEQKARALRVIIKQANQPGLQNVRYQWDIICDQITRDSLIRLGPSEVQAQPATVRYGYEIPVLVERLAIEDIFLEAFDLSIELFSDMQAANRDNEAGYATLRGHKGRLQCVTTLDSLRSVLDSEGEELPELLKSLLEKVSEVHPIIGSAIVIPGTKAPARTAKQDRPAKTASGKLKPEGLKGVDKQS